jgi:hypothetical protein
MSTYLLTGVTPLGAAVVVQLRVVDGEGAVYAVGSRATRGLTVLVTDETGKPVEGASVSFRLPDSGPGGTFAGGLRSQVVTTQADGRASIWGMQWNKTPGPFEIRITAVKDQARAGLLSAQTLSDSAAAVAGGTGTFQASHHSRTKWILIGAAVLGAAGAGIVAGKMEASKTSVAPVVQTTIAMPVITIGHP